MDYDNGLWSIVYGLKEATKKPRCEAHRGWEDTEFNRYERRVGVVLCLLRGALRVGMQFWIRLLFIRNVIGRALLSLGFDCVRSLHERGRSCQVGISVPQVFGIHPQRRVNPAGRCWMDVFDFNKHLHSSKTSRRVLGLILNRESCLRDVATRI